MRRTILSSLLRLVFEYGKASAAQIQVGFSGWVPVPQNVRHTVVFVGSARALTLTTLA